MSKTYETLLTDRRGAVTTIMLNRPESLNAFNDTLLDELNDVLKAVERDGGVRCVVLTGAGRAFSSGQDLKQLKERYVEGYVPHVGDHLRKKYNPLVSRIMSMDKPVIGAVNGVAAGAGCSLALACDLRIAAQSATFIEVFVNVGLIPDSGSTYTLPRLVGQARAAEMCFLGGKVTAAEALSWGLVNRVVPDGELMSEAGKLAEKLAALPTRGLALTKRLLRRSLHSSLDDQLEQEAFGQETAGQTADHMEGVRAFLEKRPPRFSGR